MNEPIFISEETVVKLLDWNTTYQAMKVAMESVSMKRAIQKPRTYTTCLNSETSLLTMPGHLNDCKFGALGCKLVTIASSNRNLPIPLPPINAHILYFDEETGVLKAIIAATEITKWRTAAASAVATKYLKNSKKLVILAILGAGAQGESHAMAFHHLFEFKEIRIWNHNKTKALQLVNNLNKSYNTTKFKCFESNEKCVEDADVIVTATFSPTPVVQAEWLKQGVHINAVGVGISHHSELSESIYLSSYVYVDHWAGAETELGGLTKLGIKFKGEIGSLIAGDSSPPPSNKVTVFQSLGMAVEDCAMARIIYDRYTNQLNS